MNSNMILIVELSQHTVCIHALTTLKMATWMAKMCQWSIHNKITFIKPKCIC